jgi:hypothetical protein
VRLTDSGYLQLERRVAPVARWGRTVAIEPLAAHGKMMAKKAPERPVKPAHTARRTGEDPRVAKLLASLRVDPDLAPIVDAFEENAKATGRRSFGSNGLKVNGKLFALFTQRTMVVKLPKDRVVSLVASNVGEPFDQVMGG